MKSITFVKGIFSLLVIVLIAIAFFTFNTFTEYKNDAKWVKHTNLVKFKLEHIIVQLDHLETAQIGYALTADSVFIKPAIGKKNTIWHDIADLDSLTSDNPYQQSNIANLKKLVSSQFELTEGLISGQNQTSLDQQSTDTQELAAKSNMEDIRILIDKMHKEEINLLRQRSKQVTETSLYVPILLTSFTILSLGTLLYLYLYLLKAFTKKEKAEKVATSQIKKLDEEARIRLLAEQMLEGVLDSSTNGIMSFVAVRDEKNKIVDFEWQMVNSMAEQITGKKKESLINQRLLEIMPGNKTSGLFDRYCEVVEKGIMAEIEQYYSHEELDSWFFITAIKLNDGFVATFSDITKQKLQHKLIIENETLLSEAEKLAETGSWEWNIVSDKIVWSKNVYKIYGLSADDTIPTFDTFIEYLHPEDKDEVTRIIQESVEKQEPYRVGFRIIINDKIKHINANARANHDELGNFIGYLGTIQDISVEKEYEQLLLKQTEELKKSNEELEQFAYVASHDLQEPLRKIRSFGDRLVTKYGAQLDDTGKDYIDRMSNASARMQTLIQDLLRFSRVSRNIEKFERVDLNDVFSAVLANMQIAIENTKATIHCEKLPIIKGNPTQLQQLFQNILSNAIKFHKNEVSPEVNISVRKVPGKSLNFENADPSQQYHEIIIKDNGIGFDNQYLNKIFSIFQRLHGRNEYEGTGIGLAICEKVVSNHHGFITAHGEKGQGAEFKIFLPFISNYKNQQNAKTRNNHYFNG